jgi:rhodanese-related sulfurtransferase
MPQEIDRQQVERLVEAGAQLVEVLAANEYEEEHLPAAMNIPLKRIDSEAPTRLDMNRPVIVYCWDSA